MKALALRQAVRADLPEIMRLERAGFASAIQETEAAFGARLDAFAAGCWVLGDADHRLYGYLCAELWPYSDAVPASRFARNHSAHQAHHRAGEELYVSSMVVDPATRGTGWGRRLFCQSLAAMQARFTQVRSTILIVHPEWHAARQIYGSEGFQEIGSVPGYFALGQEQFAPALIMRRAVVAATS
jgi:ribosomal protein S18 acetylase RimI-like enzyme